MQLAAHLLHTQLKLEYKLKLECDKDKEEKSSEARQAELNDALRKLTAMPEGAPYDKVEAALQMACSPKILARLKFDARFEAQLHATVTKLAALTIFEVTSEVLRVRHPPRPAPHRTAPPRHRHRHRHRRRQSAGGVGRRQDTLP